MCKPSSEDKRPLTRAFVVDQGDLVVAGRTRDAGSPVDKSTAGESWRLDPYRRPSPGPPAERYRPRASTQFATQAVAGIDSKSGWDGRSLRAVRQRGRRCRSGCATVSRHGLVQFAPLTPADPAFVGGGSGGHSDLAEQSKLVNKPPKLVRSGYCPALRHRRGDAGRRRRQPDPNQVRGRFAKMCRACPIPAGSGGSARQ